MYNFTRGVNFYESESKRLKGEMALAVERLSKCREEQRRFRLNSNLPSQITTVASGNRTAQTYEVLWGGEKLGEVEEYWPLRGAGPEFFIKDKKTGGSMWFVEFKMAVWHVLDVAGLSEKAEDLLKEEMKNADT